MDKLSIQNIQKLVEMGFSESEAILSLSQKKSVSLAADFLISKKKVPNLVSLSEGSLARAPSQSPLQRHATNCTSVSSKLNINPENEMEFTGEVKFFDDDKMFGFIKFDDADIFFHYSDKADSNEVFAVGSTVTFKIGENSIPGKNMGRIIAKNVKNKDEIEEAYQKMERPVKKIGIVVEIKEQYGFVQDKKTSQTYMFNYAANALQKNFEVGNYVLFFVEVVIFRGLTIKKAVQLEYFEKSKNNFEPSAPQSIMIADLRHNYFYRHETYPADESRSIEFKALTKTSKVVQHIMDITEKYMVAFLNAEGGKTLFGILDNGYIVGLKLNRKMRDDIRVGIDSLVAQIKPTVTNDMYSVTFFPVLDRSVVLQDFFVVCVECQKGNNIFVDNKNTAWIRRDGSVRIMSIPMAQALWQTRMDEKLKTSHLRHSNPSMLQELIKQAVSSELQKVVESSRPNWLLSASQTKPAQAPAHTAPADRKAAKPTTWAEGSAVESFAARKSSPPVGRHVEFFEPAAPSQKERGGRDVIVIDCKAPGKQIDGRKGKGAIVVSLKDNSARKRVPDIINLLDLDDLERFESFSRPAKAEGKSSAGDLGGVEICEWDGPKSLQEVPRAKQPRKTAAMYQKGGEDRKDKNGGKGEEKRSMKENENGAERSMKEAQRSLIDDDLVERLTKKGHALSTVLEAIYLLNKENRGRQKLGEEETLCRLEERLEAGGAADKSGHDDGWRSNCESLNFERLENEARKDMKSKKKRESELCQDRAALLKRTGEDRNFGANSVKEEAKKMNETMDNNVNDVFDLFAIAESKIFKKAKVHKESLRKPSKGLFGYINDQETSSKRSKATKKISSKGSSPSPKISEALLEEDMFSSEQLYKVSELVYPVVADLMRSDSCFRDALKKFVAYNKKISGTGDVANPIYKTKLTRGNLYCSFLKFKLDKIDYFFKSDGVKHFDVAEELVSKQALCDLEDRALLFRYRAKARREAAPKGEESKTSARNIKTSASLECAQCPSCNVEIPIRNLISHVENCAEFIEKQKKALEEFKTRRVCSNYTKEMKLFGDEKEILQCKRCEMFFDCPDQFSEHVC